jgi:hypothetical protein
VDRDYREHALRLDRQHSPAGQTPILDRLTSFTRVRALVFGGYGEASTDVHPLLDLAADRMADKHWRFMGAQTIEEHRSFAIQRLRRRLGLVVARAFTRFTLNRLAMVGVANPSAVRMPPRDVPPRQYLAYDFMAAQVWDAAPDLNGPG